MLVPVTGDGTAQFPVTPKERNGGARNSVKVVQHRGSSVCGDVPKESMRVKVSCHVNMWSSMVCVAFVSNTLYRAGCAWQTDKRLFWQISKLEDLA